MTQKLEPIATPAGFRLNLVESHSSNYRQIQAQLFDSITCHLPADQVTRRHKKGVDEAVNIAVFVRANRKGVPKPLPAEVFLSHGLADKNYTLIRNRDTRKPFLNLFRDVLVPGDWMKRKLLHHEDVELPADRIHVVGWPRLDGLLGDDRGAVRSERDPERLVRILWAPSHDFQRYGDDQVPLSSYPEFEPSFEKLADHAETRLSLHPRNRENKTPTNDDLLWADVVVSDFGTMVYEAWALGKPVIFPRWILQDRLPRFLPGSAEAFIFENDIGLHPGSYDELVDLVRIGSTVEPDVKSFLDDYLDPSTYGRSGRMIAEKLVEIHARDHGAG